MVNGDTGMIQAEECTRRADMNWNDNLAPWVIGSIVVLLLLAWVIQRMVRRGQRIRSEANPRKISIKDIDKMEDGSGCCWPG